MSPITLPPAARAQRAARPITFVFNGGPGAASAYLHLGALGPRVIATGADGEFLPPPQKLIDNPDSWLDMTDLVFVDPVGTGYSREAPGQEHRSFWGVNQDASSMGAFIRLYLAQNGRTGSPLFLAGESYGGFRAALLARTLAGGCRHQPERHRADLAGAGIHAGAARRIRAAALGARTALARGGAPAQRRRYRRCACGRSSPRSNDYALGDYLTALASGLEQGGRLASQRVAEITGLPLDLVQRNFARIPTGLFAKEFARAKRQGAQPL